jgi:hypothetical protein
LAEVVDVGGVNHPVGGGRSAAQGAEVFQGAAVNRSASGGQRRGGLVRAGKPHDLIPRADKLADDSGTDETGGSGNEQAHGALL